MNFRALYEIGEVPRKQKPHRSQLPDGNRVLAVGAVQKPWLAHKLGEPASSFIPSVPPYPTLAASVCASSLLPSMGPALVLPHVSMNISGRGREVTAGKT